MTALEALIAELKAKRLASLDGDAIEQLKFARLVLGAWPTILRALEELNARRVV